MRKTSLGVKIIGILGILFAIGWIAAFVWFSNPAPEFRQEETNQEEVAQEEAMTDQ